MIALVTWNLVPLGIALAIGLLTGWWMFARRAPALPPEEPPTT